MLKPEENERLVRVGRGTPAGELFRRYWMPALLSSEIAEVDGPPARVRLLGENLIAFRDSNGRTGLLDAFSFALTISALAFAASGCGNDDEETGAGVSATETATAAGGTRYSDASLEYRARCSVPSSASATPAHRSSATSSRTAARRMRVVNGWRRCLSDDPSASARPQGTLMAFPT